MANENGWIGVDLDGTLAHYETWMGCDQIGEPIEPMVNRVKQWLAEGKNVRILTARAYAPPNDAGRQYEAAKAMLAILEWCSYHLDKALPVTCQKDYDMIEFWDDRCIQVEKNTGRRIYGSV